VTPRTSLSTRYRTVSATFAALVLLVAGAPAEAAKKPRKRAQVVCFKKAGKKVCRKRRVVRKAATPQPAVLPPAVSAPAAAVESVPAPSAPAPAVTAPVAAPADPAPLVPAPDCGTSPWVGYTAADVDGVFKLIGRRTCVPGPTVLFQLVNRDAQEHNLYAEGISPAAPKRAIVATVDPAQTVEVSATLPAGEWRLFCDIEGHGTMSRTLTVTG